MLHRIDDLMQANVSFAFETTLSTKSYKQRILKAKQQGYTITLLFFWLSSIELAKERVKTRVSEGGHHIDEEVIERRYKRGIFNLFDVYLPIVDGAFLFDNTLGQPELLMQKFVDGNISIKKIEKYNQIKFFYDNERRTN